MWIFAQCSPRLRPNDIISVAAADLCWKFHSNNSIRFRIPIKIKELNALKQSQLKQT